MNQQNSDGGNLNQPSDFNIKPVVLTGRHVRLEFLSLSHVDDLARFNGDAELWRFMSFAKLETLDELREWVAAAAEEHEQGEGIAFAIIEAAANRAVGSTNLYDISARHRHLEIGRTWLGRPYWRTALNTECKFLLF